MNHQHGVAADSSARRSAVVDMAKGIATILVVYGHCLRGLVAAGVVHTNSWLVVTDFVIYTFHMPIFFVLSGVFFKSSALKNRRDFWLNRLKSIVYPYVLWSLIQGGIRIALSGSGAVNNDMEFDRLLDIFWSPISTLWFLYALFFCNVICFALLRVRTAALLTGALCVFIASHFLATGVINDIFYGLLYFVLGMFVREHNWLSNVAPSWGRTGFLACAFIVVALGLDNAGVQDRLAFPAALLGITATLTLCATLEKAALARPIANALNVIGQFSMPIYLIHILVLGFTRTLLLRLLHTDNLLVLIPVAVTASVLIPIGIQFMAMRVRLNDWVGLPSSFRAAGRNPSA